MRMVENPNSWCNTYERWKVDQRFFFCLHQITLTLCTFPLNFSFSFIVDSTHIRKLFGYFPCTFLLLLPPILPTLKFTRFCLLILGFMNILCSSNHFLVDQNPLRDYVYFWGFKIIAQLHWKLDLSSLLSVITRGRDWMCVWFTKVTRTRTTKRNSRISTSQHRVCVGSLLKIVWVQLKGSLECTNFVTKCQQLSLL